MTLKVVLIVASFVVLLNSYATSNTHEHRENQHSSMTLERDIEQGVYRGEMRPLVQGEEGQWRKGRYVVKGRQEEERRVHGKRENDDGREVEGERYDEQGNVKVFGKQIRLIGDENNVPSHEGSSESYEIMTAQKQYHNTDTEYAGNGRKVSNHMGVRSHRAHKPHLQDSDEMVNKIYKDM